MQKKVFVMKRTRVPCVEMSFLKHFQSRYDADTGTGVACDLQIGKDVLPDTTTYPQTEMFRMANLIGEERPDGYGLWMHPSDIKTIPPIMPGESIMKSVQKYYQLLRG